MRSLLTGFRGRLALIALGGLAIRVLYVLTVARHTRGIGDALFFHDEANLVSGGHGFVEPVQRGAGLGSFPSAAHPPLYPLLLAGLSKVGLASYAWHRAAGAALGAITVILVGLLGRRVGRERVGLVAAALAAVYPVLVTADGALMSETAYSIPIALALLAAYGLRERPTVRAAALLGAAIGAAALVRSEGIGLLVVLVVPLACVAGDTWRRRALLALAAVLSTAVVLAPWAIRNAAVFHRFVPLSTNDATVVAGANCGATYHGPDIGGWRIDCTSPRRYHNEAVQAAAWRSEGIRYASGHAGRAVLVAGVRVLRTFDLWKPSALAGFAEGVPRRAAEVATVSYFMLLPFALAGALLLRRSRRGLWMLLAPGGLVVVSSLLGWGLPRFRHAFELSLLVLAAVALVAAADRRIARRR